MATYDLASTSPPVIAIGDILNCSYSGAVKSIELPAGTYKLEVWGASGGRGSDGSGKSQTKYNVQGLGGYSVGTLNLSKKNTFYIYVGGQGENVTGKNSNGYAGGFNGGGNGGALAYTSSYTNGSGGGQLFRRIALHNKNTPLI